MSEVGTVRLTCFNFETEGKQKLKFELNEFQHPIYGAVNQIQGEYTLFNANGSYKPSNYFQLDAPTQADLLAKTVTRLGYMFENLTPDETKMKLFQGLVATALCMPQLDANSRGFEVGLDLLTGANYSDDIIEGHQDTQSLAFLYRQLIADMSLKYDTFWHNDFEHMTQIGDKIAKIFDASGAVNALGNVKTKLTSEFPEGIPDSLKHGILGLVQSIEGGLLHCNHEGSMTFSEKGLGFLRGHDAGLGPVLEYYAFIQKIVVPEHIRRTLLFQLVLQGVRDFSGLSNDLLGLMKDIEEGEGSRSNVILRKVVQEGIPFHKSFAHVLKSLRDTVADTELAMDLLTAAFPKEDSLLKFLQCAKDLCDGQSIGYGLAYQYKNGRYGKIPVEIVPV